MRVPGLDLLRGFAVLVMFADHVLAVWQPLSPFRVLTRIALPVFFVLAGHLVPAVPKWRPCVAVGAWGLVLPVLVPWIDHPNVLLWWALGVPIVAYAQRLPDRGLLYVVFALTLAANGWIRPQHAYDGAAVWSMMLIGRQLPLREWCAKLSGPSWLEFLGRRALVAYVVHVLVLTTISGPSTNGVRSQHPVAAVGGASGAD
jgi:uncharacterized membrane protein YeiB